MIIIVTWDMIFFFKQKTAYEMRISDWSSDVCSSDLPDGTREGFRTLKTILEAKPDTKVIVVSGHGERASALTAIASGAWDFYQKPIDIDELGLIVARAFHVRELEVENARLAERGAGDNRVLGGLITGAPEMRLGEGRGGKGGVSPGKSRWVPDHKK